MRPKKPSLHASYVNSAVKFSSRDIAQAMPATKEYWLHDATTRGLSLKIMPSGRKVFVLRYRTQSGRQRKLTLGTFPELSVAEARKSATHHWTTIFEGDDPSRVRHDKRTITVKQLVDLYLREQAKPHLSPATYRRYEAVLKKRVVPKIGSVPLSELARSDVQSLHSSMSTTPVNANRMLSVVKAMLFKAEEWELIPRGTNPASRMRMNKENPSRRYFSDDEQRRIFDAIQTLRLDMPKSAVGFDAITLLFYTGCRPGEVLRLRWEDIDLNARTATLHKTKTGEAMLPLSDAAISFLQSIARRGSNGWVFPGPDPSRHLTTLVRPWHRVCELADIQNARLKDIRHTVGTYVAFSGNLYSAQLILRHTSPKTTQRYAHPFEEAVRRDLNFAISRIERNMHGSGDSIRRMIGEKDEG